MASFNKITLVGHLGQEPEMRFTPAGTAVTNFSLAVSRSFIKDGEKVEETDWFRVSAWGKQAESCNQYLEKGALVLVDGEISIRKYNDKDGNQRTSVDVTARNVVFLSKKGSGKYEESEGVEAEDVPF